MSIEKLDLTEDRFLAFSWENLPFRDRVKVMSGSPRTVWIFGAGASNHYALNSRGVPIPLASGFFEAFNSLPTSEGFHAHVGPLISFLHRSRGIKPTEASLWRENIEEFMTSVENEVNELRKKKDKGQKLDRKDFEKTISLAQAFNNMTFIFANVIK